MSNRKVTRWKLRPDFFNGIPGDSEMSFDGKTIKFTIDANGEFELDADIKHLPIGIFAKRIDG